MMSDALVRVRPDIAPAKYKRTDPLPVISAAFGYDPIAQRSLVREFYERWHTHGGQSARDCFGIMKRAHDFPDLRNDREKDAWQVLDWKLRQNSAWLDQKSLSEQKKTKVIQLHSTR